MNIYLVGGAVRDTLLGLIPKDRDYVIVGATKDDINSLLDSGYHWVGKDFPVFIGPDGCEYALARTERRTGLGYYGFDTYSGADVTLEQDLSRRDLTINAMALDEQGAVIDPFGGQEDLTKKRLRHVSLAFTDDPVRVLRLARFLARFGSTWQVAEETRGLCEVMHEEGRLKELVPERVWQETCKALAEPEPWLFFEHLSPFELFPELDGLIHIPQPEIHHPEIWTYDHVMLSLQQAVTLGCSTEARFAVLVHDFGKVIYNTRGKLYGHEEYGVAIVEAFCEKWKVPNRFKELAVLVTCYHGVIHGVIGNDTLGWVNPNKIVNLLINTGALHNPNRFKELLLACEADARGRRFLSDRPYPQRHYLTHCLEAVLALDTKAISADCLSKGIPGIQIGERIRAARIRAVRQVQHAWKVNSPSLCASEKQ